MKIVVDEAKKYNSLPKVLIIGEVFGAHGGGGITLGKLFEKWPAETLAIAELPCNLDKNDFNKCNNCYSFGHLEKVYRFPFNRLFTQHQSQRIREISVKSLQRYGRTNKANRFKSAFFEKVFQLFNLNSLYSSKISPCFLKWIAEFKPNYIYVQPNSPFKIEIVNQIYSITRIPYIVHVMDDYIVSWYKQGIFSPFLKRILYKSVRILFTHAYKRIAICEYMATEYSKKYKVHFEYLHNSICVDRWRQASETLASTEMLNKSIKLLHLGRISFPVINSLMLAAKAIEDLNSNDIKIELHIYSFDYSSESSKIFSSINAVYVYPPVKYEQVPRLIKQHDLLLLPLDFDRKTIQYTRLSFSTKAPEFMASGKPIIVLAPKESALSIHAQKYGWAITVNRPKIFEIQKAIMSVINSPELVNVITEKALRFAVEHCDAWNLGEKFINLFSGDRDA